MAKGGTARQETDASTNVTETTTVSVGDIGLLPGDIPLLADIISTGNVLALEAGANIVARNDARRPGLNSASGFPFLVEGPDGVLVPADEGGSAVQDVTRFLSENFILLTAVAGAGFAIWKIAK